MVSGQYYRALVQDKVRPAVYCKQPELLEHCVILLQDNAVPHHHCIVQNLVQHWGWEVLEHPPCSPDRAPCDYWFFVHVKEHLWGKLLELEDNTDTAVTSPVHCLSRDEYRAATDCLPHRWEKCVDSATDYIERRTYLYTYRNISNVIIMHFVITLKSYTELLK